MSDGKCCRVWEVAMEKGLAAYFFKLKYVWIFENGVKELHP